MYANSAPSSHPIFGISGGWQQGGGADAGTIYKGEQAFRPLNIDVAGFTKTKGDDDIYTYDPSMAYVYANAPKPAPVETPNVTSFLSSPIIPAATTGNYGAGRFSSNGLLGLDFGLPAGKSANTGE